jgi:uncharacterized protein
MDLTDGLCGVLMGTARDAILAALRNQNPPPLNCCEPALLQLAGCFVTLHEMGTHRLRGCIGTFESNRPLIETVQAMAVGALSDPRFFNWRITESDLPRLDLEISVLSPLRPMSGPMDFDLLTEGIYMVFGQRTGVFLPQVARETGWSKETLLEHLCADKMGLSPLVWRNPHARFFAYTVKILGPEGFVK